MKYNNFAQILSASFRPGVFQLLLCCAALALPGMIAAQKCTVYFTDCPREVTVVDCDRSGTEVITWNVPTANTTGNCGPVSVQQISGPALGSTVAAPGEYQVVYRAQSKDFATGKISVAECIIPIHVISDVEPPVFTFCPPDITVFAGESGTGTAYWPNPVVTDNCGSEIRVDTKTPCGSEFPGGTNTVYYIATDPAGNITLCSFTVTVIETFGIEHRGMKCPADITVNANPTTSQAADVSLGLPEMDDKSTPVNVRNNAQNRYFHGKNVVTWTAMDGKGEVQTCKQLVVVKAGSEIYSAATDSRTTTGFKPANTQIAADQFQLAPNPFSDRMQISTTKSLDADFTVQVFNQQQQAIAEKRWPAGLHTIELNAANWPAGVYSIKILTKEGAFAGVLRGIKF